MMDEIDETIKQLKDDDKNIKESAIAYLKTFAENGTKLGDLVIDSVIECLHDEQRTVRLCALNCLNTFAEKGLM